MLPDPLLLGSVLDLASFYSFVQFVLNKIFLNRINFIVSKNPLMIWVMPGNLISYIEISLPLVFNDIYSLRKSFYVLKVQLKVHIWIKR